jgi:hypothetical protein
MVTWNSMRIKDFVEYEEYEEERHFTLSRDSGVTEHLSYNNELDEILGIAKPGRFSHSKISNCFFTNLIDWSN